MLSASSQQLVRLKILSRDSSNAKVLDDLQRKSDSLFVKSKAKKAVVSKSGL